MKGGTWFYTIDLSIKKRPPFQTVFIDEWAIKPRKETGSLQNMNRSGINRIGYSFATGR